MFYVWFIIIEALLLVAYTVYLVWHYAQLEKTPIYVYILTGVGWFIGLAIILLIPLDIFLVSIREYSDSRQFYKHQGFTNHLFMV